MRTRDAWIFYYPVTDDQLIDEGVVEELAIMKVNMPYSACWNWRPYHKVRFPFLAEEIRKKNVPINVEILIDLT